MLVKTHSSSDVLNPVAILDKELLNAGSFQIEIFELCSLCGARFGIGYFGESTEGLRHAEEFDALPGKLIEILAKDHLRHREHKGFIELDV
jgi:hypothetical protein